MTTVTLPSGKYLIVGVNPECKQVQLYPDPLLGNVLIGYQTAIVVPRNSTLIGVDPLNLTEDEWKGIVERFNNGAFRDYSVPIFSPDNDSLPFELTATDSGSSLLTANGHKQGSAVILKVNE